MHMKIPCFFNQATYGTDFKFLILPFKTYHEKALNLGQLNVPGNKRRV